MASLQYTFNTENLENSSEIQNLIIEVEFPRFSFVNDHGTLRRFTNGIKKFKASHQITDKEYFVDLPLSEIVGNKLEDIYGFFRYHFIDLLNPQIDINDFSVQFKVNIKDSFGQLIKSEMFEGIFYQKASISSDFDERNFNQELSDYENSYRPYDENSQLGRIYNIEALQNLAKERNPNVFILNKQVFEFFKLDIYTKSKTIRTDDFSRLSSISEAQILDLLQIVVDLKQDHVNPDIYLVQLNDYLKNILKINVNEDSNNPVIAFLYENINKYQNFLLDFPLTLAKIETVSVKGNLEFLTDKEVANEELDFYSLVLEAPRISNTPLILKYNWNSYNDAISNNKIDFSFDNSTPIITNSLSNFITVKLKGFDGTILWNERFNPNDEKLQKLSIKIEEYSPGNINLGSNINSKKGIKKIRGKVLQNNNKHKLKDLTITIKAKKEIDSEAQIVAGTTTDKSGNFFMPYPYGNYTEAQIFVSLMPNRPAEIKIYPDNNNETISDDFIFLLLDEESVIDLDKEKEDDCGCNETKKAKRLPDQADLIESDEYSQDIGGTCLNLSTPNRTLREYSYNAIVRITDPEVSNYTLKKIEVEDGTICYNLTPGNEEETYKREEIGLNNPVSWQDSPLVTKASNYPNQDSDLSFYQAVTVATGHILHFKSVFKADGYSLGDLVYSLPLAPGQKKQIVVFESSHALQGAESQSLSQGESLTAGLISDRFITDQLSGGINESLSGQSKAHTSGMSAGIGAAGSYGGIGASLGVAGGFSNSNSSASQNSSRNISQFFGEKLRQSLMQNAESYRALNASVVTTVTQDQNYGVTAETIANHNHCHSLTMMYFEVLRHYAIYQEVSHVEECVFIPLLLTHFTTENINKWKDILATNLLPIPSNTYLGKFSYFFGKRNHPLLKAFDANKRIQTNYDRVDFPKEGETYADGDVESIQGRFSMNVNMPRPKTKYDRIKSLPIITKITKHSEFDALATAKAFASPWPWDWGPKFKEVETRTLEKAKMFDHFMTMDDNFQSVPAAQCIRVVNFHRPYNVENNGVNFSIQREEFFDGGHIDKLLWESYAKILDYTGEDAVYDMLDYYFKGRLIAEWDEIFYKDILPIVFSKIVDSISIHYGSVTTSEIKKTVTINGESKIVTDYKFKPEGAGLPLDFSTETKYTGGHKKINVNFRSTGPIGQTRKDLGGDEKYLSIISNNEDIYDLKNHIKLNLGRVSLHYSTAHFTGRIFNGYVNDDLLDGTNLYIPLTRRDKLNPRKEDEYLVNELIEHLNSNLEHYNKVLWKNLDPDRRYMLLDGFSIQTYTSSGHKGKMRSIASVVKNELINITGNSLVFPVADGYKVGQNVILETIGDNVTQEISLLDYYKPLTPIPPYRISVPTRGVFMEAVQGSCDSCEMVKENSSQDWDKFRTEETTSISPIVTPTPTINEYKPQYKDFAQPLVNIQNAPDAPAPAAGLSGINQLLGKSDVFKDITGLADNQSNAIETFKANTEAAQKYAEMASSLAKQQHNTKNAKGIQGDINKAKNEGVISDEDAKKLTRQHLQQQIDGGESIRNEAKFEREQSRPSLSEIASEAVSKGQSVEAERTDSDGVQESFKIQKLISSGNNDNQEVEISENALFTNIWSWTRARMPYKDDLRKEGIQRIKNTGITDVVFHLNSINSPNSFEFLDNKSQNQIIDGLRTTLDSFQNEGLYLNIHLMFFPRPFRGFIRDAVDQILPIVQEFRIKSVLLDAEKNWRKIGSQHQWCSNYLRDNFKNQLGDTKLGFTSDVKLTGRGALLARICDYLMPQAYSTSGTKHNDAHLRRPGEMQVGRYNSYSTLNIPIIFALAAWDLQKPRNIPNASDYDTMAYTINKILEIENYDPREIAYWTLPLVQHNSEIERFIKELKVAIV
ncbi:hypothetical protein [Aquimarina sp. RZ0]|uniref:hypothetical protein n=1 Tax=Aquimarina sp. RZ0 TaxID=2607730 RepID=UPI0011F3C6F4|nr:hypothetical protein [Aquimarina sp. RZ0]KAA1243719.1 hypothetical protein F0000_19705 [Aquimarina sp. RZ0]